MTPTRPQGAEITDYVDDPILFALLRVNLEHNYLGHPEAAGLKHEGEENRDLVGALLIANGNRFPGPHHKYTRDSIQFEHIPLHEDMSQALEQRIIETKDGARIVGERSISSPLHFDGAILDAYDELKHTALPWYKRAAHRITRASPTNGTGFEALLERYLPPDYQHLGAETLDPTELSGRTKTALAFALLGGTSYLLRQTIYDGAHTGAVVRMEGRKDGAGKLVSYELVQAFIQEGVELPNGEAYIDADRKAAMRVRKYSFDIASQQLRLMNDGFIKPSELRSREMPIVPIYHARAQRSA